MAVRIITDSTSDIDREWAAKLGITVVPLTIRIGDEEFVDGVTISTEEFYRKMEASPTLPTTSQVTVSVFEDLFKSIKESGDEAVLITIASELSGTYQSAVIAHELVSYENIHIVDSKTVTMGLTNLVLEAIKLKDSGKSAAEIADEIRALREKVYLLAVVDNLENLVKGGRMNAIVGKIGGMLKLKPILRVDGPKILAIHKTRGLDAAFTWLVKTFIAADLDFSKSFIIGDVDATDSREIFQKMIFEAMPEIKEYYNTKLGSTVSTHSGLGCVGMAGFIK